MGGGTQTRDKDLAVETHSDFLTDLPYSGVIIGELSKVSRAPNGSSLWALGSC